MTIGSNSGFASKQLISVVERVERLEEEKAALADDIKEVYSEAKGNGFDTKIIRKCIQLRKMDGDKRREMEEMLELYWAALEQGDRAEYEKSVAEAV